MNSRPFVITMKRKRLIVLGATGSIGESAAKVAQDIPERVEIVGIAANSKARELAAQANKLRPKAVCIVDESKLAELNRMMASIASPTGEEKQLALALVDSMNATGVAAHYQPMGDDQGNAVGRIAGTATGARAQR